MPCICIQALQEERQKEEEEQNMNTDVDQIWNMDSFVMLCWFSHLWQIQLKVMLDL